MASDQGEINLSKNSEYKPMNGYQKYVPPLFQCNYCVGGGSNSAAVSSLTNSCFRPSHQCRALVSNCMYVCRMWRIGSKVVIILKFMDIDENIYLLYFFSNINVDKQNLSMDFN